MPADKGKVLVAIEAILKGKSATKNFKDSIATKWAAKIDTDEEIEAYVSDRSDVLLEASTEADRRATQATTKAKADAAAAVTGKTEPDTSTTTEAEPDTEIGKLMKMMQGLTQTVTNLQQERQTETLQQKYHKALKEAGIPDQLAKYLPLPKDEAGIADSVTQHATDLKPLIDAGKTAGFGTETIPHVANPTGGNQGGKGKVDPAVLAFADKQAKQFETQNQKN
jgi:hypothetical protein